MSDPSPEAPPPERRERRAWVVALLADTLIAFGLVVLVGRMMGRELVPTLPSGSPPISSSCAVGLLIAGAALHLRAMDNLHAAG